MLFRRFAEFLEKLEGMSSRNEMTVVLAELLKELSAEEADKAVYLALGYLAPPYAGLEIGLAEKMMARVVARAFGVTEIEAWREYKKAGDWGSATLQIPNPKSQIPKKLTIGDVYEELVRIAKEGGEGSQERKVEMLANLLKEVGDGRSAKYLARIPIGRLRLGFSDVTILDALSVMKSGDKSLRKEIERAFNVMVDIGRIAKVFKKDPREIAKIQSEPGIPIRPALAERIPTAEKIIEKLGECVVEPKYDGVRVQVHITTQGEVSIFSRNLESTTAMFPDLVLAAKKELPRGVVFDGEAIAYDPKTNKFLPFQETSQRKRKHDIEEKARELPLRVFLFDVLYANGHSHLNSSYRERREVLERMVKDKGTFIKAKYLAVKNAQEIRAEFRESIKAGLEGLMVKKPDSVYQAGGRNFNWVKFKKNTETESGKSRLIDTLDCVVMGIYRGRGKRVGFGVGAFLVGVLGANKKLNIKDQKSTRIFTIAKIGTGLTDDKWREMERRGRELLVQEKPPEYDVDKNLSPDVWMRPKLVVEILADEITRSPIHSAGLALRFPRLIRFRDDKNYLDATTLTEVEKLFKLQGR